MHHGRLNQISMVVRDQDSSRPPEDSTAVARGVPAHPALRQRGERASWEIARQVEGVNALSGRVKGGVLTGPFHPLSVVLSDAVYVGPGTDF